MSDMDKTAQHWLWSRNVIMKLLRELMPSMIQKDIEYNAAALIARLANHDPPLLICTPDEMKEES